MFQKKRKDTDDDSEDENQAEQPQPSVVPTTTADTRSRYFVGKDYSNCYEKDFVILEKYNEGNPEVSPL